MFLCFRIERFWRDVFYGCTSFYYNVFSCLEADGILNVDNAKHISVLHYVFIPRIKTPRWISRRMEPASPIQRIELHSATVDATTPSSTIL